MIRTLGISVVSLTGLLWGVAPAEAQVFVRAPFVQVETGPGVYVRAPFFRLWIPNSPPPAYVVPPNEPPLLMPPAVINRPTIIQVPANPTPRPQPVVTDPLPVPEVLQGRYPTLAEFAQSFQPRGGVHDVTVINPITQQPVQVRFLLPEGTPRRVIVESDEIEFRYNIRQFVRIEFRRNGVTVINR